MADKPACPDAAAAPALAASWGALSAEEARTAASLLAAGLAHLFASWPPPGEGGRGGGGTREAHAGEAGDGAGTPPPPPRDPRRTRAGRGEDAMTTAVADRTSAGDARSVRSTAAA